MSVPRIIWKYPNRRLYDCGRSRYVTVADVRTLVAEGSEFAVIDKKSGEDITRSVLLHVITESELSNESVMSAAFLRQVIRSYGTPRQAAIYAALEQSTLNAA
jgi:polyhydroxyalkanoate synthesis repressor PhaR